MDEVFEIIDYTSASEWERFITAIEQTILQWGIDSGSLGSFEHDSFHVKTQVLSLHDNQYTLYYYYNPEILDLNNNYKNNNNYNNNNHHNNSSSNSSSNSSNQMTATGQTTAFISSNGKSYGPFVDGTKQMPLHHRNKMPVHPLHRWTGKPRLMILRPFFQPQQQQQTSLLNVVSVNNETFDLSTAKLIISAFSVAFSTSKCCVPVFIPTAQAAKQLYIGYEFEPNVTDITNMNGITGRIDDDGCFEFRTRMAMINHIPPAYSTIQGIIKLFEERTAVDSLSIGQCDRKPKLEISVCQTFEIPNYEKKLFQKSRNTLVPNGNSRNALLSTTLTCYHGAYIVESHLDRILYTDSDPLQCSMAVLSVDFDSSVLFEYPRQSTDISALPLWTRILFEFVGFWQEYSQDYLKHSAPDLPDPSDSTGMGSTNQKLSNRLKQGLKPLFSIENSMFKSGLGSDVLVKGVDDLFAGKAIVRDSAEATERSKFDSFKGNFMFPSGSFVVKFCQLLVDLYTDQQQPIPTLLQALWAETVDRLRKCWREGVIIPLTSSKQHGDSQEADCIVDLNQPLLHQKIAMLNYCIQRKVVNGGYARAIEADFEKVDPSDQSSQDDVHQESMAQLSLKILSSLTASDTLKPIPTSLLSSQQPTTVTTSDQSESSQVHANVPHLSGTLENDSQILLNQLDYMNAGDSSKAQAATRAPTRTTVTASTTEACPKKSVSIVPENNLEFDGRKQLLTGLLLLNTDEPMWEPKTQDPGVMTEDSLQEQQILFEKLGTSAEAQQIRAKMQSSQLLSDMQGFKAANPGCLLEDFVRWHSPKDWIVDDTDDSAFKTDTGDETYTKRDPFNKTDTKTHSNCSKSHKGHLSSRMTNQGNFWQELWKTANPVPASRQTPLFDYEKQAEKCICYFESLDFNQVMPIIFPVICSYCVECLSVSESCSNSFKSALATAHNFLYNIHWEECASMDDPFDLQAFITAVHEVEVISVVVGCLTSKFPGQPALVEALLSSREVKLQTPEDLSLIQRLVGEFKSLSLRTLPKTEYVLTGVQSCNQETVLFESGLFAAGIRDLKHRMYISIDSDGFRMVETTSQDGNYN